MCAKKQIVNYIIFLSHAQASTRTLLVEKEWTLLASLFCCHSVGHVIILKDVFSCKNEHIIDIVFPTS